MNFIMRDILGDDLESAATSCQPSGEKKPKRALSSEEIQRFRKQLCGYEDYTLRMIHEYFTQDLTHILQELPTHALLLELRSRKDVLDVEKYSSIKEQHGAEYFADSLLREILDLGREAVIGLWECLFALQEDHPHPNLLAALDEITHRGDHLMEQILLDEHGHCLTSELKDLQEKHKQHLLEKSQNLVERRPPGSSLEEREFPIIERYVDLIIVSTDEFRHRSQNELIQTGERHEKCLKETQSGLEHISPNRLFRWSRQSHGAPHAVMVSGVPGIGKTTLMQKLLYDWVTGKLYQRFCFVFFFRFRDLNKLPEVSLEEMILHQYPYLQSQLRHILQDPEKLLFIFDSLDESIHHMDFTSHKPCRDPKRREDSGVIVDSLVRKRLLNGCSVLMTSRPTKLAYIDTRVFQRIAEIMGFLPRDRLIYFERFFVNKELSEKAFHYVQENDTLYTFCYIPSFCWIICTVIAMCFRAQPTNTNQLMASLPKTTTQLFVTFVSNILSNHSLENEGHMARELLTSMGWMAEYGVMDHKIVFDERDLDLYRMRNNRHLFSCFLMESGHPPDVDYTFLHLTLQEFFAALVHYIDYNAGRLQESLENVESHKDGRAGIFMCFLCGLSDLSTRSMLRSHVGELSVPASTHIITWLQEKITNQQSTQDKKELLSVFYFLYESRNKPLVSECLKSLRSIEFAGVILSPLDCSVLSWILESLKKTEELNLSECNIQNEGLRKLVPALHTIKNLSLYNNELTNLSCKNLASGIRNNETLKVLDLSSNNLEGPHLKDLMVALKTSKIERLLLRYNHLTNSCCPLLASAIRNTPSLRTLDLSRNNLEGPLLSDLMEALTTSSIEELRLVDNRLIDGSCPQLASGIRNNPALRKLDLSDNNLEGPHLKDLMEALTTSSIEEFLLKGNKLTHSSCHHLASGIRKRPTLRKLDLSDNILAGADIGELMSALAVSRIEELILQNIGLKDEHATLVESLSDMGRLTLLDLSRNQLSKAASGDIQHLVENSPRLRDIRISDNPLSEKTLSQLRTLENTREGLKVVTH